jgi:hypothetical protein
VSAALITVVKALADKQFLNVRPNPSDRKDAVLRFARVKDDGDMGPLLSRVLTPCGGGDGEPVFFRVDYSELTAVYPALSGVDVSDLQLAYWFHENPLDVLERRPASFAVAKTLDEHADTPIAELMELANNLGPIDIRKFVRATLDCALVPLRGVQPCFELRKGIPFSADDVIDKSIFYEASIISNDVRQLTISPSVFFVRKLVRARLGLSMGLDRPLTNFKVLAAFIGIIECDAVPLTFDRIVSQDHLCDIYHYFNPIVTPAAPDQEPLRLSFTTRPRVSVPYDVLCRLHHLPLLKPIVSPTDDQSVQYELDIAPELHVRLLADFAALQFHFRELVPRIKLIQTNNRRYARLSAKVKLLTELQEQDLLIIAENTKHVETLKAEIDQGEVEIRAMEETLAMGRIDDAIHRERATHAAPRQAEVTAKPATTRTSSRADVAKRPATAKSAATAAVCGVSGAGKTAAVAKTLAPAKPVATTPVCRVPGASKTASTAAVTKTLAHAKPVAITAVGRVSGASKTASTAAVTKTLAPVKPVAMTGVCGVSGANKTASTADVAKTLAPAKPVATTAVGRVYGAGQTAAVAKRLAPAKPVATTAECRVSGAGKTASTAAVTKTLAPAKPVATTAMGRVSGANKTASAADVAKRLAPSKPVATTAVGRVFEAEKTALTADVPCSGTQPPVERVVSKTQVVEPVAATRAKAIHATAAGGATMVARETPVAGTTSSVTQSAVPRKQPLQRAQLKEQPTGVANKRTTSKPATQQNQQRAPQLQQEPQAVETMLSVVGEATPEKPLVEEAALEPKGQSNLLAAISQTQIPGPPTRLDRRPSPKTTVSPYLPQSSSRVKPGISQTTTRSTTPATTPKLNASLRPKTTATVASSSSRRLPTKH